MDLYLITGTLDVINILAVWGYPGNQSNHLLYFSGLSACMQNKDRDKYLHPCSFLPYCSFHFSGRTYN